MNVTETPQPVEVEAEVAQLSHPTIGRVDFHAMCPFSSDARLDVYVVKEATQSRFYLLRNGKEACFRRLEGVFISAIWVSSAEITVETTAKVYKLVRTDSQWRMAY